MIPKDALIYACSGCSSSAQMANALAVQMDRDGIAEMSCIAGVGGGVKPLVNKAKSARAIISLDGCSLHCVEHCLEQHGLKSTVHYDLSKMGVRKKYHRDFDAAQKEDLYQTQKSSAQMNQIKRSGL